MEYRKLIGAIIFATFFMILGRNLDFVPRVGLPGQTPTNVSSLKKEVSEYTKKQKGSYSIYYKSFKHNASFGISENQMITAASVNKVPIVAVLYHLANKGEINLDDKITILEKDIQDYGTGSLRYKKAGESVSLRNLAKIALKESDNTAAHLISVRIGADKIQQTVNEWGLTQTRMADNKTSAFDMYLLFEKIYKGEVTDKVHTKELLSALTDSIFEDRIPALLPKDLLVYHKTGDTEGGVNDVGIIENGQIVFYVGILTTDIGQDEEQTKKAIAEISKMIYSFEENL